MIWKHMKKLLQGRFLSTDYQKIFTINLNTTKLGIRTVAAYMKDFYRLSSWCNLSMMKEQQATKYTGGLKYPSNNAWSFMMCSLSMKTTIRPWRLRDYKVGLHLLGDKHSLRRHKLEQTVNCQSTDPYTPVNWSSNSRTRNSNNTCKE